jgi:hypothetical protein
MLCDRIGAVHRRQFGRLIVVRLPPMTQRSQMLIAIGLLFFLRSDPGFTADAKHTTRVVKPCPNSVAVRPVVDECAAAAIAETEFLKATGRDKPVYTIVAIEQTHPEWRFTILLGDEQHPAGPGQHYFVLIDSQSGAAALVPGE